MKQTHKNFLNMSLSLISFFEKSESTWASVTPVSEVYNQFHSAVGKLSAISMDQKQFDTRGYTAQKKRQKKELIDLTYGLSLKLKSYATINSNDVLLRAVNYSVTTLNEFAAQDLVNTCRSVHGKGAEFKTQAEGYQITDEELGNLLKSINTYQAMLVERDEIGDKRTLATADIDRFFKEGALSLRLLDSTVKGIIKDKVFLAGYEQARKVSDLKGQTRGRGTAPEQAPPPEEEL